jgi:lactoylglutathione lyase
MAEERDAHGLIVAAGGVRARINVMADSVAFNHVGQCVVELERSKRFYVELLGFTVEREIQPPDDLSAQLLRLPPPLGMTACYLRRDGLVLELLHFASTPVREHSPRAMNEPGLTHVSLSVDDVDGVLAGVEQYGGEVLTDTNIGFGVFVRDPDGQLVEILPMAYRGALDAPGR